MPLAMSGTSAWGRTRTLALAAVGVMLALPMAAAEERPVPRSVLTAARLAGERTGVDPAFLLAVAWRESSMRPDASSRRSSADGLFQFTNDSWLRAMHEFGGRHGMAGLAAAIEPRGDGFVVRGRGNLRRILALRAVPRVAAVMAGEAFARDMPVVEAAAGHALHAPEAYLIHVLGAYGAVRYLEVAQRRPRASALLAAGGGAAGNRGLFTREGRVLGAKEALHLIGAEIDVRRQGYAAQLATR